MNTQQEKKVLKINRIESTVEMAKTYQDIEYDAVFQTLETPSHAIQTRLDVIEPLYDDESYTREYSELAAPGPHVFKRPQLSQDKLVYLDQIAKQAR
jgi:hypothetical protein